MKYIDKLLNLKNEIGHTKMVKLVFEYKGNEKTIYAKEEFLNPSGSIKIRPAYQILFDAIRSGKLKEGQRVVEVTSGNMGIALAYLCIRIGNPITIIMPKTMSEERKQILKNLGVDIVLTDNFLEAFEKQKEYEKSNAFLTKQFDNPSNLKAHEETAEEIINSKIKFDGFVSGVGTAGTLIGCGGFLKEKLGTKLIAIDPIESSLLINKKSKGKHKIQGLSDQIIPDLYKKELVDQIIEIDSNDAICMARKIKKEFGVAVGISSGANVLGAILSNLGRVVTVFADDDKKYASTDLTNKSLKSLVADEIKFISCKTIRLQLVWYVK